MTSQQLNNQLTNVTNDIRLENSSRQKIVDEIDFLEGKIKGLRTDRQLTVESISDCPPIMQTAKFIQCKNLIDADISEIDQEIESTEDLLKIKQNQLATANQNIQELNDLQDSIRSQINSMNAVNENLSASGQTMDTLITKSQSQAAAQKLQSEEEARRKRVITWIALGVGLLILIAIGLWLRNKYGK